MTDEYLAERSVLWARLSVNHTKRTCFAALMIPITSLIIVIPIFKLNQPTENEFDVSQNLKDNTLDN